jgi:preprotein translocase subunit SecG
MLTILITIVHVIMCLTLIAIVLLQSGKGANMGAAFGGGSNTLFGSTGPASFLNKVTTVAAIVFMITSFTLAIVSSRSDTSSKVLENVPTQQEQPAEQTTPASEEAPATAPDESSSSSEEAPATVPDETDPASEGAPTSEETQEEQESSTSE